MTLKIIDLRNYRLDLHLRGSNTLVVTFETGIPEPLPPIDRAGWGAFVLQNRREDWLAVKVKDGINYYRRQDWFDWLADRGPFFSLYDRIITLGASMGGYGALAFSEPMRVSECLVFAPRGTLAPDLVPWDNRLAQRNTENWSGPYRDAAKSLRGKVTIVSDPFDFYDSRHTARLAHAATVIDFPMVGHNIPIWLMKLGVLAPAIDAFIDGRDPAPMLRQAIARRRELEQYWGMLGGQQERRGRHRLARRIYDEMQARRDQLIPIKSVT